MANSDTINIHKSNNIKPNLDRLIASHAAKTGVTLSYGDMVTLCVAAELERREVPYVRSTAGSCPSPREAEDDWVAELSSRVG